MNPFLQMLFYALLAVTVENVFFTEGIGFSRVLRAARKTKGMLLVYTAFLCGFSIICSLLTPLISRLFRQDTGSTFYIPLIFAATAAASYLIVAFIFKTWLLDVYKKIDQTISSSAINSVVLAVPFIQHTLKYSIAQSVGFAVGTGAAFLIAVLVFSQAMVKFQASDMPKAFKGLPAVFIYIGILAMAFFGFTGGKL